MSRFLPYTIPQDFDRFASEADIQVELAQEWAMTALCLGFNRSTQHMRKIYKLAS